MHLRYLTACLLAASPIVAASLTALAQARTGHHKGLLAPLLWYAGTDGATTLSDVHHVDAAVWTPQVPSAAAAPAGYLVRADTTDTASEPGWDPVTGLGAPGRAFLTDVA